MGVSKAIAASVADGGGLDIASRWERLTSFMFKTCVQRNIEFRARDSAIVR